MDIKISQFTDPICTWCWASEPVLRKLEYKLGLDIDFVMGGLVGDIRDFGNGPMTMKDLNQMIYDHWVKAAKSHHMPLGTRDLGIFTEDNPSSYLQNMAYKAGQLEDELLAKKLLRRIREATFCDGLNTGDINVLVYLADEIGLDQDNFVINMQGARVQEDFLKDKALAQAYGINGFPSYTINYNDKDYILKGFQPYEAFVQLFKDKLELDLEERSLEKSPEAVLDFVNTYEKLADQEIKYVFDLEEKEYEKIIKSLLLRAQVFRWKDFVYSRDRFFKLEI